MPRDGSGIYSVPIGTAGVPNTTISSTKYNNLIADLVQDANAPRPITAGGTGATSGSAALTALGVSAFAKTLLDDADAAIARATLAIGDAFLRYDAAQVLAGTPLTSARENLSKILGDTVLVASGNVSGLAQLDLALPAEFEVFELIMDITAGTSGQTPNFRFSTDNAVSYLAASYSYGVAFNTGPGPTGSGAVAISFGSNVTTFSVPMTIRIFNRGGLPQIVFDASLASTTPANFRVMGSGHHQTVAKATHFRTLMSSGTLSANYKLLGIR